ncbi:MAG TPA: fumarylacetoacetate hydrolase family protein [Stellaceae bacterium]|jgi:2-keto-4-pentenoate hydratase
MPPLSPETVDAAAEWLAAQLTAAAPPPAFTSDMPAGLRPETEDDGYRIQRALEARLSERGFGPTIGWKVGATTLGTQRLLKMPGPGAGRMFRASVVEPGSRLDARLFRRAGIECEIVVILARGLDARTRPVTLDEAAAAVGEMRPAIEIVDYRFGGELGTTGAPMLIADNLLHSRIVLGEPPDRAPSPDELPSLVGVTLANGRETARGTGADVLGHPLQAVVWLANRLGQLGRTVEAGETVMTGTIPAPYWLAPGDRIEIRIDRLGSVAVSFDG